MDYTTFRSLVKRTGFKNTELCQLLHLNPKSFNNYTQQGVPMNMAIIVTLIHKLQETGMIKADIVELLSETVEGYTNTNVSYTPSHINKPE
jgi:hypothetical protein